MPIEGIKQIIFDFYFLIEQKNDRIINGIKIYVSCLIQQIKRQIIKIHFAQNNLKIQCWMLLKYILNRSLKRNNLE